MSSQHTKTPRYSQHFLSRNSTPGSTTKPELTSAITAPKNVKRISTAQSQTYPGGAKTRSIAVAPIRSLSIRSPHRYPSASELGRSEDEQQPPQKERQRVAAATIASTIERLEDLVVQPAAMGTYRNNSSGTRGISAMQRNSPKPSPSIKFRDLSVPLDPPLPPPPKARIPGSVLEPQVSFSHSTEVLQRNDATQHQLLSDRIRPCESVHAQNTLLKSSLAPAALTQPNEDFEMESMRRRSRTNTHLHEQLEPALPALVATQMKEQKCYPSQRRGDNRTMVSCKTNKKRVKANMPPTVLPRSTSVRIPELIDDCESTFAATSLPDLKVLNLELQPQHEPHWSQMFAIESGRIGNDFPFKSPTRTPKIDLKGRRHVDVLIHLEDFDLHKSCQHAPVARDWPTSRKRFAAAIACLNTACIGIVIGIYSGEVPAIQYLIVDFHHYTILGNVFLYCGLAIPTLLLWPLPLLHGRKLYTIAGMALALCLQIPQGVSVGQYRSPYVATYRVLLLLSRALSGFAFGFVNINAQATLLDVFGASLQSTNPHGEIVDPYDVRRHGGGMGVWLSVWSFASTGSISLGFTVGAFIISDGNATWGFWTSLLLLMVILLLNIVAPEVRRSAYRRTVAEVRGEEGDFSRVARGEVKMHLNATGPFWWGEEVLAGIELNWLMIRQPGFLVLAVYTAWVYAQFTMILMFLGALASRYYMFIPTHVGLCVLGLTLGALLAIPFQKASWLSRARSHPPRTNSMTLRRGMVWSSHLLRRAIFTILLPLAALASTLTSSGPPLSIAVPCLFAAVVGFLSNLAMAECYGLIMETFDTTDLQPGMTGRPSRLSVVARYGAQRTNFSCYPRVSAGSAVVQSLMFIFAAAATGLCGRLERKVGAMMGTACVASALLVLTLLLTGALFRGRSVKMIPERKHSFAGDESGWEPVILGRPSGTTRKISILEAGQLTRWTEIRRRNRLDESTLTGS